MKDYFRLYDDNGCRKLLLNINGYDKSIGEF